ncbi:hypothetical protein EJ05DRAFT_537024 [Pseudovirgaria hyperparasitica]|uniref:Uncharacterized protein n=1 Tax=Pseudovirgaria hyperparasitica TaxID=470096 RepID=A0A6A6WFA2_9PEZI|nr:uncharacterized protein EJ05DRAFT_537024 [Pseudovirgaria hyperparasitica]KAF2759791.1 hypothetical protein EJ05DRAFT_537024 [Pseudovirgaria hyperparasitica]
MSTIYAIFIAVWITRALCTMQFVNPPPFGEPGDFSSNPTFTLGSTLTIIWKAGEEGKATSLVLYQLATPSGDWVEDMEYLAQGAIGLTRYTWLVGTRKDLQTSNIFYMSLYREGSTTPDANSHYFYLKKNESQPTSTLSFGPTNTSTSRVPQLNTPSPGPKVIDVF